MQNPKDYLFSQIIEALLDSETPLNPKYLYRLSDLEAEDLDKLKAIWKDIPTWRRQALLEDIEALSERDTLLSFVDFCCFAVSDEDPRVRLLATQTLLDYEETELIEIFMNVLAKDPNTEVRAAAAGALGRFVFAGELDKIAPDRLQQVENLLLKVSREEYPTSIRRAALEALGYSSREEVTELIRSAYESKEREWVASALFAMGRSANEIWQPNIMAMLDSNLPLLRSEAARAAGELEIRSAKPYLLDMLEDPDENARNAAIWSLSQIGGEGVRETLERLYKQTEYEDDLELLEAALDNLVFSEGASLMPMFGLPEDDGLNAVAEQEIDSDFFDDNDDYTDDDTIDFDDDYFGDYDDDSDLDLDEDISDYIDHDLYD